MRIHFQEKPWDLYLAIGYTLGLSGLLLVMGVGNPAAILLVLFAPGYVLVAALFPTNRDIDWIERIALGIGLSIAVVPLLGLALNFTSLGIRFAPVVAFIAAFTGGVGVVAYWRRLVLPVVNRLELTVDLGAPRWKGESLIDRALTVSLAASIVLAAAVVAYVVATPRPREHFTEFYVLDCNGTTSEYPRRLNVSEPGCILIGVKNLEVARVDYTVRVDLVGGQFMNVSGRLQFVERNRTDLDWSNRSLDDGQRWTWPYTFSIASVGVWRLHFILFRDGVFDVTAPYRSVHLFVNVTAPGAAPTAPTSSFAAPTTPPTEAVLMSAASPSVSGATRSRR
ncbi:MAG: DUF1616 domain-containing protein [Methanobacteriota archaeon]